MLMSGGPPVPHTCHTPGESTVNAGNSGNEAPSAPAYTTALLLLIQGYRPSNLVVRVRFSAPAPHIAAGQRLARLSRFGERALIASTLASEPQPVVNWTSRS